MPTQGAGSPGGRRGRPPRIDRDRIVAAALSLAPGRLTMQAVADALGVDRTALHYYVGDRGGLLELVVTHLFEAQIARERLPHDAPWPDLLRAYTVAIHHGVVRVGVPDAPLRLRSTGSLAVAERVLEALVGAGFTVDEAGQALTLASGIAYTAAHDLLGDEQSRLHQAPEVARALGELPTGRYPLLAQVVSARADTDAADFEFSVDVVIAGLDRRLQARRPGV
ncbi:MAG TPA: TetR/AcrR family transcriptional regulator C-terminal domain-containing protein [Mycolicibacillus parakoreensis]|uniref:TetR/AcrR family transcriptional regulator C-terminal domain-containing protein n=1 Tax=Mycolicibacillus parakoreensis TaxID=1069221 RepID=A0ABY3U7M9_9MYCO|nr:TetR/AcrR family transcriptional regulator C-terminal domain-containing protein [Mycolicibacillus parakoreensis]ULN54757.1 TetR/AcrR family transcriptional regulator C-terminal domain-containing protein [Mycolicibacillus parakoreensis]HLR99983.1 TetR/AcrR family transcriptional regulator C-terminal domain-containing protein [Mycolicibacillus parakoreensis]